MIVELSLIFILIVINGLFAMGEMAIVSARKARLKSMADQGNVGARTALQLASEPTQFLSTVQIGITVVNVLTGTVGGVTLADQFTVRLATIPLLAPYAETLGIVIVVVGISYVSLIVGELAPKRIALSDPEGLSAKLAGFMRVVSIIATPAGWFLSRSTDLVLRLLRTRQGPPPPVTDEEIRILMQEGTEAGEFHEGERTIVEMALRLGDRRVGALMTPRTQIEVLDLEDPPEENRRKLLEGTLSRYPVVEGDLSKVVGVLTMRDVAAAALRGETPDITQLMKPPLFVPETAPALRALESFKSTGQQLALIVDEYGDIEGLVTLNDVLEALIGDIAAPGGDSTAEAVRRPDGSWLIDGLMPMDEVRDLVGLGRPGPDAEDGAGFQTLGGFVMARLKRIPRAADLFDSDGFRFEVMDMDGRRVDKVLVSKPEPDQDS